MKGACVTRWSTCCVGVGWTASCSPLARGDEAPHPVRSPIRRGGGLETRRASLDACAAVRHRFRSTEHPLRAAGPPAPRARRVERLQPSYEIGQLTNGRPGPRARGAHGRLPRCRPRRGHELLHLRADADRAGGDRGRPRPRRAPELHVLAPRPMRWSGTDAAHGSWRTIRSPSRSISTTPRPLLDGASAIMGTHVFGAPCQPEEVEALAASAGIPVLFDAAHAIGARHKERPVGGFGSAEVFSLTPTKPMVAGEGGLVATNDGESGRPSAHRARLRQPGRLQHAVRGPQRPDVGVPRRGGARVSGHDRRDARATPRDRLHYIAGLRRHPRPSHAGSSTSTMCRRTRTSPSPSTRTSSASVGTAGRDPRGRGDRHPELLRSARPSPARVPGRGARSICRRPTPRVAASSRSPSTPTSCPTTSTRSSPRSGWPTRTQISSTGTSTWTFASPRRTAPPT